MAAAAPQPPPHVSRPHIIARDATNGAEILLFLVRWFFEHEDQPYTPDLANDFHVEFERRFGLDVDCEYTTLSQIIRCTQNPALDIRV